MAQVSEFAFMNVAARRDAAAFERQFENAVRERARLLYNLRYPAARATKRILEALRWEFDTTVWPKQPPDFFARVDTWVAEVYRQMTPGK